MVNSSCLRRLTLVVPPGENPLILSDWDGLLSLFMLPALRLLRLRGPIVREAGTAPFLFPSRVKVRLKLVWKALRQLF